MNQEIVLYWILSHTGIKKNNKKDLAKKSDLNETPDKNFKILYADLKTGINDNIKNYKNGKNAGTIIYIINLALSNRSKENGKNFKKS